MLMVIFGAGASYDSAPSLSAKVASLNEHRPPLANQLFSNRKEFVTAMNQFPECLPVIPYLQHLSDGSSVEAVLEQLQGEAQNYPPRHRQITSIRYYLQFMIRQCQSNWEADFAKGITNYTTFMDQIEHWRYKAGEKVCLVTFNYDTMLENAFPFVGISVRNLNDYIADPNYKLIKVHGSVNWAREVDTWFESLPRLKGLEVVRELISRSAELEISDRYRLVEEFPIAKYKDRALFPAVAIPVETKRNFECPKDQIQVLQGLIPEVTKLIIVGWRGTEYNFLEMLSGGLKHIRGIIANGGGDSGKETVERLKRAGLNTDAISWIDAGFTDFIIKREADKFLRAG